MSYHQNGYSNFSQVPGLPAIPGVPATLPPTPLQQLMTGLPQIPAEITAADLKLAPSSTSSQITSSVTQAVILITVFGTVIGLMYMFLNLFKM